MIPRIKSVKPLKGYRLYVIFDDGRNCIYDVNDDISTIKEYGDLKTVSGLFEQVQLDESRTCIYWNDFIDLPSDTVYEYSSPVTTDFLAWDHDFTKLTPAEKRELEEAEVDPETIPMTLSTGIRDTGKLIKNIQIFKKK